MLASRPASLHSAATAIERGALSRPWPALRRSARGRPRRGRARLRLVHRARPGRGQPRLHPRRQRHPRGDFAHPDELPVTAGLAGARAALRARWRDAIARRRRRGRPRDGPRSPRRSAGRCGAMCAARPPWSRARRRGRRPGASASGAAARRGAGQPRPGCSPLPLALNAAGLVAGLLTLDAVALPAHGARFRPPAARAPAARCSTRWSADPRARGAGRARAGAARLLRRGRRRPPRARLRRRRRPGPGGGRAGRASGGRGRGRGPARAAPPRGQSSPRAAWTSSCSRRGVHPPHVPRGRAT